MKKAKKWIGSLLGAMAAYCLFLPVEAAGDAAVVERYTSGNEIVLYVKGVEGADWEAEYQIGTTVCPAPDINLLEEAEETIYTLILWDNSLSVMKKNESAIKSILTDVVANRAPREKFAIALLGEELTYLTDYSSDYASLKQIIEGTESENKEAYFVENLYEAVKSLNEISDAGYKRILVISDGMDATQTGYSERELLDLLEKNTYLVYSIGVDGGEAQALQNMFSISRTTNAEYYYLAEIEDTLDVVKSIGEDYGIVQVKATVPDELQDGSTQNSQIVLTSGAESYTLQCQVALPFLSNRGNEEAQPTQAPEEPDMIDETEETTEPETVPALSDNTLGKDSANLLPWIGIGAGAAILIIVILLVVILSGKKKKDIASGNDYEKLDQQIKNERAGSGPNGSGTDVAPKAQGNAKVGQGKGSAESKSETGSRSEAGGTKTLLLFETQKSLLDTAPQRAVGRKIILTATTDPGKAYQCGITDSIVIGRKPTACNLAIATDDAVSERHCEISVVQDKFYIKDLGSSNGTYVNGKRIDSVTEINSGCTIKIGRGEYRLTIQQW